MLWILLTLILALWAFGLAFGIAGNLIHGLLGIALIILVIQVLKGRRVPQKT